MELSLSLVGDVMIGRSFNDLFSKKPNFNIWGNTLPILRSSNILVGNLETTLTTSEDKWPDKAFNFKLDPKYASILSFPRFDFLSLANNHILDFGLPGLFSTLTTLDSLGIHHAGAGFNLGIAQKTAVLPLSNGKFLHIISAADHYDYWAANLKNSKGLEGIFWFDLQNPNNLLSFVSDYSSKLSSKDVLMTSLHWGPNWEATVSNEKRYLAYQLAHLGVKVVHGHSAHHLQSVEMINDSTIFYSMGDFIDDYKVKEEFSSNIGAIATLDIKGNGRVALTAYRRTIISDLQVNLL